MKPNQNWAWLWVLAAGLLILSAAQPSGCNLTGYSGPKHLLVVHESADDTPEQARLLISLQDGPVAKQLADAGSTVTVLDKDATDADGKPLPLLEKFKPYTTPEVLILTKDERLLRRMKQPATAAEILGVAK